MSEERHSRVVDGRRHTYLTQRLWRLAADLPTIEVPIDEIAEFDQDCWFTGGDVTCRMVAEHTRRIVAADLSHPVILSADGRLMDGVHRIAKAWLDGHTTVRAVRFVTDPAPDHVGDLRPERCGALNRRRVDRPPLAPVASSAIKQWSSAIEQLDQASGLVLRGARRVAVFGRRAG